MVIPVKTTAPVPDLKTLADATLLDLCAEKAQDVVAGTLWQSQPAVIVAFRRPGCLMCRDEAAKLWALKEQFDGAGVRLVGLVLENVAAEIEEFRKGWWPGELYLDVDKTFYKALGGGKLKHGSLLSFLYPFSQTWRAYFRSAQGVKNWNLKGQGLIMGGLLIVRKGDAGVQFVFPEKTIGVQAEPQLVLDEARIAAKLS